MSFLLFLLTALLPLLFNAGWDLWILTLIHLLTLVVMVIIAFRGSKNEKLIFSYSHIDVFFLIFLFFCLFSYVFSINRFNSRNEIYNYINYYLFYFLASYLFNTIGKKLTFLYSLIGMGIFISIIALSQWWQGKATVGTLVNANVFSAFLILCMLTAMTLWFRENNSPQKKMRSFLFVSFFVFSVLLTFTRSLGAWLSFFCGSCLFLFTMLKMKLLKVKKTVVYGAVAVVVVVSTFLVYFATMKAKEPGVVNRLYWWKGAVAISKEYPLRGVGLGNFESMYLHYKTEGLNSIYAHNYPLQILSETGIFGFLSLLLLLFFIGKQYVRQLAVGNEENQFLFLGGLSIFSALLIHSIIDFGLNIPAIAILFWVLIGMSLSGRQRRTIVIEWNNTKKTVCVFAFVVVAVWVFRPFVASQKFVQGKDELFVNNLDKAEEHFLWSIRLDGLNPETYAFLGDVYYQKKRKGLAIHYLKKAITLNPYYGPFHHNLSLIYAELGNLEEALCAAERARDVYPLKPLYHYTLSIFYGKAGRTRDAENEFRRYKELSERSYHN